MNKYQVVLLFCLLITCGLPAYVSGQVSINQDNSDPDPSAMLDIKSTDKGLLIPRMTSSERDAISQPATGLQIYNTDHSVFNYYDGTTWLTSDSPWKTKGDSIYYDLGPIGIGTDAPTEKLTLAGGNFLHTAGGPTHVGAITGNATIAMDGAIGLYVSGKYAYVISKEDDGVEIFDISDPTNPDFLGAIFDDAITVLESPRDIQVSGKYAYIAAYNGVEILDISDPTNPTHVGAIKDDFSTILSSTTDIYVSGKYAYLTSVLENGVEILDISDPTNPTHVGSITDDATTALLGPSGIYVVGKYAYVTSIYENGVEVLDISDPSNPTHVGAIFDDATTELEGAYAIYVSGKYAYVTSVFDNGVEILDISDPTNPIHVGAITDNATTALDIPLGIYVSGKYAYVTSHNDDGVEILDISDPTNPTHVGAIFDDATTELDGPVSIVVSGKYAYVASLEDDGVEILDISGMDVPAANIGNITTNHLDVSEHAQVGNLSVREGLTVGIKGISVDGDLALQGQISMREGAYVGFIPVSDASGAMTWGDPTSIDFGSDDLGNHTATQNLELSNHNILNAGAVQAGAFFGDGSGLTNLAVDDADPVNELQNLSQVLTKGNNAGGVSLSNLGSVSGNSFVGDGSGLTNIPFDNLGNHTATQNLNLNSQNMNNGGTITAASFVGSGTGLTGINVNDADASSTNELQNLSQVLVQGTNAGGANISNLGSVSGSSFVGDGSGLTIAGPEIYHTSTDGATNYPNNDNWQDVSNSVILPNWSQGDLLKIEANLSLRLTTGNGVDPFGIRVKLDFNSCSEEYSNTINFTPPEGNNDHDNFTTVQYLDMLTLNFCSAGTLTITLQAQNSGDDTWSTQDRMLMITNLK